MTTIDTTGIPAIVVARLNIAARQAKRALLRDFGISTDLATLKAMAHQEAEDNAKQSGGRHPDDPVVLGFLQDVFRDLLIERTVATV